MLNDTWLTAFHLVDAVFIAFCAGVDIHGLVNCGRQIGLGGLLCEVGAGYLHLQTGFVRCCGYDVKVFCVQFSIPPVIWQIYSLLSAS